MVQTRLIRVLIIESHDLLRGSLRLLDDLFDDLAVVGEAEDGEQGLALCAACQPDVVLVERYLPRLDTLTFTRSVTQTQPQVKVIIWSTFEQPGDETLAVAAGASRYLLKDMNLDAVAEAIRTVAKE